MSMSGLEALASSGPDPMDVFSRPSSVTETKLGILLDVPVRRDPKKPGRSLAVTWDLRFPMIPGFSCAYSYVMRFDQAGAVAGNHFHRIKREIFYPVAGSFVVGLLDICTGEREEAIITAAQPRFLFVPAPVAHVVTAQDDGACLLVTADSPNTSGDEFPMMVLQ
jgi:WxcM-like, C-terminal